MHPVVLVGGEGLPDKARTYIGRPEIFVDRNLWQGLSTVGRSAILAHETAHQEDPSRCENCSDVRAGALLRADGYSERATSKALDIVKNRDSAPNLMAGWNLMQRNGRLRGLDSIRASWELSFVESAPDEGAVRCADAPTVVTFDEGDGLAVVAPSPVDHSKQVVGSFFLLSALAVALYAMR